MVHALTKGRELLAYAVCDYVCVCLHRQWLEKNPDAVQSGYRVIDQGVTSLLKTSLFVGGLTGMVLDNTIPGERFFICQIGKSPKGNKNYQTKKSH
ncbi:Solute carrier family 23 member 1 [Portunus trituberculatus]|uniref:Solute carrier family 23 member 1 n=1 Tax=Portunus trituberculatus TaxID=210409 RepID=A0A5B7JYM9_PORTR|nr:Solute carrier family 23 member 1 [Portunus trituberculatus]